MAAMSGKKMTGKQAIAGGFDLDAFVSGAEAATEELSELPEPRQEPQKAKRRPNLPVTEKNRSQANSRPRKQPDELVSERVQLMVSPTELAKIKEQAGLVSISKFLRKYLQDNGLI